MLKSPFRTTGKTLDRSKSSCCHPLSSGLLVLKNPWNVQIDCGLMQIRVMFHSSQQRIPHTLVPVAAPLKLKIVFFWFPHPHFHPCKWIHIMNSSPNKTCMLSVLVPSPSCKFISSLVCDWPDESCVTDTSPCIETYLTLLKENYKIATWWWWWILGVIFRLFQ